MAISKGTPEQNQDRGGHQSRGSPADNADKPLETGEIYQ